MEAKHSFQRDQQSTALINKDDQQYQIYKAVRERNQKIMKIDLMEKRIEHLEDTVNRLIQIIERNNVSSK